MKKQSIWVFEWRQSVHYWWSYILFSPECKELTSMLDPLLYRWGVPPVVIRCVRWTMQSGVQQTWIKALGIANVMKMGILCTNFVWLTVNYWVYIFSWKSLYEGCWIKIKKLIKVISAGLGAFPAVVGWPFWLTWGGLTGDSDSWSGKGKKTFNY